MFYMCYTSRKHVQCNFLNNEWLRNLEISTLFMFAFYQLLKTDVECPHICEHCNKCIQPVTFVLFSSRLFSIRWQGLRIMKYKMDSHPKIKNQGRSSHECVRPSVKRDFNLLFWDHYMTWRSSMSRWKLFCLSQAFHCELSFGNENSNKNIAVLYISLISLTAIHANICTNLRLPVLVSAHFCIYQLTSAISKKKM